MYRHARFNPGPMIVPGEIGPAPVATELPALWVEGSGEQSGSASAGMLALGIGLSILGGAMMGGLAGVILNKGFGTGAAIGATSAAISSASAVGIAAVRKRAR